MLRHRPQQHPVPHPPFWDAAYTHFPQPVALPQSSGIAWSIYITDLFILFQDNFHHCSKCVWKETEACHVAADTRKQGKKILHPLQMFSLLASGAGASLNFNQMSNKTGLVENKLSVIYGVSCKQESTLSSRSLPAYVFLLCFAQGELPLISPL